ncbi:MAG: DUF58 domain-containing protein, partial [Methanobacteriota archaeon]
GVNKTLAVVLREFEHAGIREYVPGDKARDINWKALSRLGKLMTNAYNKEGTLETMVMIDCSRSMRLASYKVAKIDHATDLALQLSRALLSNYHRTGVTAFDETSVISGVNPSLSRHQFEKIMMALREIPGSIKVQESGTAAEMTRNESPQTSVLKGAAHDRGEAFLDALSSIASRRHTRVREIGLVGAVGDMILRRRGSEMLFVIISDLMSSRESVVSAANLCRRTGNRALVIQTYDDWYSKPRSAFDLAEAELLYNNMDAAVGVEAALRRSGASFLRVGPADNTARIVRSIRRRAA